LKIYAWDVIEVVWKGSLILVFAVSLKIGLSNVVKVIIFEYLTKVDFLTKGVAVLTFLWQP